MFLLFFLMLCLSVAFVCGVLIVWLANVLVHRFILHRAHFVVAGSDNVRRVDVTQEMRDLGSLASNRFKLLPYLSGKAMRGDLREVLNACQQLASDGPRVRRSPICFLDVEYSFGSIFYEPRRYRCMYPIYSFSDYIQYRPTFPIMTLAKHTTGIESAILTIRSIDGDGHSRQMSLNVTDCILRLQGPCGDFHGQSSAGYQLRKHILRNLLMPDILTMTKEVEIEDDETAESASVENSSNSLKSLRQRPSMSVRLQIRLVPSQRLEVMVL